MLFNSSHAEVTEVELVVESQGYVPVGIPAAQVAGDEKRHYGLFKIGKVLQGAGNFLFRPHTFPSFLPCTTLRLFEYSRKS